MGARRIWVAAAAAVFVAGCADAAAPGREADASIDLAAVGDAAVPDAGGPDLAHVVDLAGVPQPDAAQVCPSPVPNDPLRAARLSCSFDGGAPASATLGLTEAARAQLPIKHVIVVMKENRSFDHLFGGLAATQPDAELFPATFTNPDGNGTAVAPFHLTTTCAFADPGHQWDEMHAQINGGKMDGYVKSAATSTGTDGHFAIGYYDGNDLPFYYFLANTFALSDHYFPSVRSGTFPNRDYLVLGTSDKVTATQYTVWPSPSLASIFDRLDAAKVTWTVYADDHPLEESLNDPAHDWETLHTWKPVQELVNALNNDTLPSVAFVDGRENVEDEHPIADLQVGEAWTKRLYDALVASKAWPSTVMLLTYDEAGGFFDHLPPPNTCPARAADAAFFELGTRVPLIAISPWARRHHVSKSVQEHTSITRFIEAVFGLPALTARDANSDGLFDLFDFQCPPTAVPTAPASGKGGCKAATLTLDKAAYASGETIVATFANGAGSTLDWIGVYPLGTAPHTGSTIWVYLGGGHTAPAVGLTHGSVSLAASSGGTAPWPLAAGNWTASYLVDDGYTPIATANFKVQ